MKLMILMLFFAWQGETAPKAEDPELMKKISYVLGNQFGQNWKKQGLGDDLDLELYMQGLTEGLQENSLYSDDEMRQMMQQFQLNMRKKMMEKRQKESEKNKAEGEAFLIANKAKEGVVTLESGLQYKVITKGEGPSPKLEDRVSVHYRGKLINGKEFDSSYKRNEPASFFVRGVIPGWIEALQKMKKGSKWELYIPARLAYGPNGSPPNIPGHATLLFDVELLDIIPTEKKEE